MLYSRVGQAAAAKEHELEQQNGIIQVGNNGHTKVNGLDNVKFAEKAAPGKQVKNSGLTLVWQQLWAMMVKKSLYSIRNRGLILAQTLIPIGFLLITLIVIKTQPPLSTPPALELNLEVRYYGQLASSVA